MLLAGQLVLPHSSSRVRFEQGWLRVDVFGRIFEMGMGSPPGRPDFGGDGFIVSPGFIDTHLHLPQFKVVGQDGLTLLGWLEKSVFPEEARWHDVDYAERMTDSAIKQLLSFGTTSFCAYATVHPDSAERAIQVAQRFGLRAAIGQVLMDRNAPKELLRPTEQLNFEATQLAAKYPPPLILKNRNASDDAHNRVEYAVTPRFAITCTEQLLGYSGMIAKLFGSLVQTHLSENEFECETVAKLFPNQTYTQVYQSAGLLTNRTLLGHGIFLSPDERRIIRENQAVISHCPIANLFLQSGMMPRALWLSEGLRTSLGSDIGAGTNRSMMGVARAMIDTARSYQISQRSAKKQDDNGSHEMISAFATPTAAEAWHQITAENATAVGWSDVGELKLQNTADLLLIRPDIDWQNADDPLSFVFYNWDDRWIKKVFVAGKISYEV